jgi:hypothetical protein
MTRLSAVLMAAGLAAGAVGCAHCDTCDDFPTPCVGPNCGGGPMGVYAMASGPVSYSAPAGATTSAPAGAALAPANDGAGPAPTAPAAGAPPAAAPPTPSPFESKPTTPTPTPPLPGEPTAPRSRPGS